MLHFFPPGMLERYLLFSFLAVLGLLQLIAARYRWVGFSIPGRQRWHWGYSLGAGFLGGSYLWFFLTAQRLIFQPGLAGAELFSVFAISALLALGMTLGLVSLLHGSPTLPQLAGERVEFEPGRGTFRHPSRAGTCSAAIVVSDLPDRHFPVLQLVSQLVNGGCTTLTIDLAGDGPVEYPEVLARLPAACTYLQNQAGVDDHSVVLIGVGIGGDLALRAAATDKAVKGVVAVEPILVADAVGLNLLQRSTYWEAIRWGGVRRRLAEALAAVERWSGIADRSALLIYRSTPVPSHEVLPDDVDAIVAHNDEETIQSIVDWATEAAGRPRHVT